MSSSEKNPLEPLDKAKEPLDNAKKSFHKECDTNTALLLKRDKLLSIYKEIDGKRSYCDICGEQCLPTFGLTCCGTYIHEKCSGDNLGIVGWTQFHSSCPFCREDISKEDLEKIREYDIPAKLMKTLENKNTRKLFEIYHNMICENKALESEIVFLDSYIKAHELVKQDACIECETDSISLGGDVAEEQKQVSNFIQKMEKLEEIILSKYEEPQNCELNLIEILYSVLTSQIEPLKNLIENNKGSESLLLLLISMSINWEKEREDIDSICAKGDISKDDIQLIYNKELESVFNQEDKHYAIILAMIKIAIAIQLMKPVNEPLNEEYVKKRRQLVSNMRDYPVYGLVSTIVELLDEEL
jgi:hypothetical protein